MPQWSEYTDQYANVTKDELIRILREGWEEYEMRILSNSLNGDRLECEVIREADEPIIVDNNARNDDLPHSGS